MNRFIALLFVALLTFFAVLYVKRPDVLHNVWMWVIGLTAPIVGLFKRLYIEIKEQFFKEKPKPQNQSPAGKATI